MVRQVVKRLLAVLPEPLDVRVSDLARFLGSARHRSFARATRFALGELGNPSAVLSGPFKGMQYPVRSGAQGGLIPKLVGSYEKELTEVVEAIISAEPRLIIDIGAADGYYAAGFAVRVAGTRVIAYEMEKPLRGVMRRVAVANAVSDRVEIRGECDVEELARVIAEGEQAEGIKRTVLMSDIEGYEDVLFDPERIPMLERCIILCEVHELQAPGVGARLRSRFASTHDITVTTSRERGAADVPPGVRLSDPAAVLDEGRTTPMDWLLMHPRANIRKGRSPTA